LDVRSEEVERLGHGLGDKDAVERVVVEKRKAGDLNGMAVSDVQFAKAADLDFSICLSGVDVDFADTGLDGDLPNADCRDKDLAGI
jgi:hypothetical protein